MDHSESNIKDSNKCRDKIDSPIEVTGFTLLEVLLTFLVLGLVLAQIAPKYNTSVQFSRDQAQQANYLKIEGAVELYRLDTGTLPTRLEDLLTAPPGLSSWRGPYLDKMPTLPNGQPYTLDVQGKVGI
ncbi:type II secretion system protein GspG [Desulfitobacterium sp. Sab5]|uniref:type II secretion system protein GspG n=1 Tax=Desulfitobacterium nosdiversum TaxID=3375356 RepID=UPI003CF49A77